jgi:hypothetical protein
VGSDESQQPDENNQCFMTSYGVLVEAELKDKKRMAVCVSGKCCWLQRGGRFGAVELSLFPPWCWWFPHPVDLSTLIELHTEK